MVSESCYVTLIENAILLFTAYGLLTLYVEDVMHYGFLFFAVFIGLCMCYASTAAGFCMMMLDDTTSTQLLLLDAERPFSTPPPNNVAHVARILARTATACSVALLLLFVTVGCEFFTEDSEPNSLPAIALRSSASETALATQLAVSTALAVYSMLVLMLLGSNQQLNGVFLRLQYMTQSVPLPPEQAAAYTTRADDFALFVRAQLGLYLVTCGCTGTFEQSALLDYLPALKHAMASRRNGVAGLFIVWCVVTDTLRIWCPPAVVCILLLTVADALQVFASIEVTEVLLRDRSLTNFACALLVLCDAACVMYAGFGRIARKIQIQPSPGKEASNTKKLYVPPPTRLKTHEEIDDVPAQELNFSGAHVNVDNIKMRVFEKKSN